MSEPVPHLLIDLDAAASNYRRLQSLAPGAETSAVIKADAYGLGMDRMASVLKEAGCKTFFVATAREGQMLRSLIGPGPDIYIFEGYWPVFDELYLQSHLKPVLNSQEQVLAWIEKNARPTALNLDTGMNRLGLSLQDFQSHMPLLEKLKPDLIMSHLACGDEPDNPKNKAQLEAFTEASALFSDTRKSLANTGGILLGESYHFDMVRPGIGIYGGHPGQTDSSPFKPVVSLDVPILQIRTIKAGETVGYGATFTAPQDMTTATLGLGYADGLIRSASNHGFAIYNNHKLPILGIVSMDLLAIDITPLKNDLKPGDRVQILGHTLDSFAYASGTIGYELLTRLGGRLERVYRD